MRNAHKLWTFFFISVLSLLIASARPKPENFYETAQRGSVIIDIPGGWGSGVIIKRKNALGQTRIFVWTARHVVADENEVAVMVGVRNSQHFRVGTLKYPVGRVWETQADAALLWIDAPADNFETALRFDDELPALGQRVFACTNPHGIVYDGVLTDGIVSQFGVAYNPRVGIVWEMADVTTAAFSPGSSGGPLFSERTHGIIGISVGTAGNGVNVYLPTRVINRAARNAGVGWAVDSGGICPPDSQLKLGPVVKALEKIWKNL